MSVYRFPYVVTFIPTKKKQTRPTPHIYDHFNPNVGTFTCKKKKKKYFNTFAIHDVACVCLFANIIRNSTMYVCRTVFV